MKNIQYYLLCLIISSCGFRKCKVFETDYTTQKLRTTESKLVVHSTKQNAAITEVQMEHAIQPESTSLLEPVLSKEQAAPLKVAAKRMIPASKAAHSSKIIQRKVKALIHQQKPQEGQSNGLIKVGWILIIVGLVVLLLASIIGGILVMLLGLVFVLAGKKN